MQPVDASLFERARAGDASAREELFEANTGLIWACLRKYAGLMDRDDLYQLGAIGLLKAIDKFDPSYGVMFSTFAVPHILGEIRRHLRDNTPLKIERRLKELSYLARKTIEEKRAATGREPTAAEIACELGVTTDTLMEALDATSPLKYLEEIPSYRERPDVSHDPGPGGALFQSMELAEAIERLDEHQRKTVEGRFLLGKTQSEIAKELGVSQAHVCRMEKAALMRLRVYLSAQEEILPRRA